MLHVLCSLHEYRTKILVLISLAYAIYILVKSFSKRSKHTENKFLTKYGNLVKVHENDSSAKILTLQADSRESSRRVRVKACAKAESESVKLLESEYCLLKELRHVNILSAIEVIDDGERIFLVLEGVDGELYERIPEDQQYTENEARELLVMLLDALNHCHERGFAHRLSFHIVTSNHIDLIIVPAHT